MCEMYNVKVLGIPEAGKFKSWSEIPDGGVNRQALVRTQPRRGQGCEAVQKFGGDAEPHELGKIRCAIGGGGGVQENGECDNGEAVKNS